MYFLTHIKRRSSQGHRRVALCVSMTRRNASGWCAVYRPGPRSRWPRLSCPTWTFLSMRPRPSMKATWPAPWWCRRTPCSSSASASWPGGSDGRRFRVAAPSLAGPALSALLYEEHLTYTTDFYDPTSTPGRWSRKRATVLAANAAGTRAPS